MYFLQILSPSVLIAASNTFPAAMTSSGRFDSYAFSSLSHASRGNFASIGRSVSPACPGKRTANSTASSVFIFTRAFRTNCDGASICSSSIPS